jgi:hypothetical protein
MTPRAEGQIPRTIRPPVVHDEMRKSPFHGEVFVEMRDAETGELVQEWHFKNVITNDASIFVARLVKDPAEPSAGAFALAVGTGDVGWDLQNVPAAASSQGSLYNELFRKQFSSIDFIDSGGLTSAIPTNVLDFTCTYAASEAVGALVEMGIVCAPVDTTPPLTANPIAQVDWNDPAIDRTAYDTFLNVRNFNVINKPGTMTLTFVWRVTF